MPSPHDPISAVRSAVWAIDEAVITSPQRLVLLAIVAFTEDRGGDACPSVGAIASMTGLGERAIQQSLNRLESMRLISVVDEYRRARVWRIDLSVCGRLGRRERLNDVRDSWPRYREDRATA